MSSSTPRLPRQPQFDMYATTSDAMEGEKIGVKFHRLHILARAHFNIMERLICDNIH